MYEVVKVVNGYKITRMKGTRGFFRVELTANSYVNFRTIKSAVEFIEGGCITARNF